MELCQQGPHLSPQAVAGEIHAVVSLVLYMTQPVGREIGLDLLPRGLEQGADQPSPHRGNARQPLRAGAAQQVQHHRLRLIRQVVGGGDAGGSDGVGRALQKVVAQAAACLLHAPALLPGNGPDVAPLHIERHAQLPAEPGHESLVPSRRGAHQMVIVGGGYGKAPAATQRRQIV